MYGGSGVTARWPAADAGTTPAHHPAAALKRKRRNLRVKTNRDKTVTDQQFEFRALYRGTLK